MKKIMIKRIKILVILGVFAGIVIFAINAYVVRTMKKYIYTYDGFTHTEPAEMADAVIVLGAFVYEDGQLSDILKERLDNGIALYHAGYTNRILMSGDHGREDYDEVQAMKDYAISQGVPSEHIFMDHAGFSTYETMYRAKDIFQAKNVLISTQEYHLPRSLYIARKLGLEAQGVICDQRSFRGATYRWGREVLARNKDFIYTVLKPEPTYLGDTIPVTGNGDQTND
jgi:vancomycin permeability regulator SanA